MHKHFIWMLGLLFIVGCGESYPPKPPAPVMKTHSWFVKTPEHESTNNQKMASIILFATLDQGYTKSDRTLNLDKIRAAQLITLKHLDTNEHVPFVISANGMSTSGLQPVELSFGEDLADGVYLLSTQDFSDPGFVKDVRFSVASTERPQLNNILVNQMEASKGVKSFEFYFSEKIELPSRSIAFNDTMGNVISYSQSFGPMRRHQIDCTSCWDLASVTIDRSKIVSTVSNKELEALSARKISSQYTLSEHSTLSIMSMRSDTYGFVFDRTE